MKLDDMKVTSSEHIGTVSGFTVHRDTRRSSGTKVLRAAGGLGVCALALIGAVTLRWQQIAYEEPTALVTVSTAEEIVAVSTSEDARTEPTDAPGSLRFAESAVKGSASSAETEKWTAPVLTSDVEVLVERKMVRFTAAAESILSCIDGKVTKTGKNDTYGTFLTIKGNDVTLKLYGFEQLSVKKNAKVAEGDVLGTVPVGRSIWLSVEKDGKAVDPSTYVDLAIQSKRASV